MKSKLKLKSKLKSKLEMISKNDIDKITKTANKKRDVPLIKSTQVNMRIDKGSLAKIKILAEKIGIPYTTFMTKLLLEDVDRLWSVSKK